MTCAQFISQLSCLLSLAHPLGWSLDRPAISRFTFLIPVTAHAFSTPPGGVSMLKESLRVLSTRLHIPFNLATGLSSSLHPLMVRSADSYAQHLSRRILALRELREKGALNHYVADKKQHDTHSHKARKHAKKKKPEKRRNLHEKHKKQHRKTPKKQHSAHTQNRAE